MVRHHRGQGVPGTLGVVQVTRGVGLEPHRELVKVLGHLVVVVEGVVAVGAAVAVEIAEHDDPVAAADVDRAVDDPDPQRLKQPRGDPPPGERVGRGSETAAGPDVAIPGAEHGDVGGKEVEAAEPQLRLPRIGGRGGERVDGESRAIVPLGDRGVERVGPAITGRPAEECCEVDGGRKVADTIREADVSSGDGDADNHGLPTWRQREHMKTIAEIEPWPDRGGRDDRRRGLVVGHPHEEVLRMW